MSTNVQYHYITLNRILDVASGEFELSIGGDTVYRLDTNDSTVNLQLNDRGNDKIPLISKRRIDVGSGGFDKIIISWSGLSVPQTLQLLIGDSQKRSDVVGVELSDFSTTVTGATSTDITKIGGSSTPVTDLSNILDYSDAKTAERVLLVIDHATSGDSTIYTVATGKILMLHEGWHLAITGNSGFEAFANFSLQDSSSTVLYNFCFNFDKSAPTAELASTAFSFPVPLKVNAGEKIVASTSANNYTIKGGLYGTLIDV